MAQPPAMSIGDFFRNTLAQNMRNIHIASSSASSSRTSSSSSYIGNEQELTAEHCLQFRNNPEVNPLTGRTIRINGYTYEQLMTRCREVEQRKKSKSSIRSTSSSLDETQLHTSCINLLSDTNNPTFRRFTNKLKKICQQHLEKCDNRRLNDIRRAYQSDVRENITYDTEFITISIVPDKPFWPQIINDYLYAPTDIGDFMKVLDENLLIKFINQKGVGQGVTRTFIQGCLDNIIEHGFFIKTDELSNRYVINPDLTLEKLQALGYQVRGESEIQFIYEKIGAFYQFCMISGYPIGFYLSRSLLYKIIKPKKTPASLSDTFVLYYLLEMPSISAGIINLLRHPETIKDTGLEFNDDFPLVETDAPLTADNFRNYLQLRTVHQYTQQLYPRAFNTHSRLEAFLNGFKLYHHKFKAYDMTVSELDKFLCGDSLTLESFMEWYSESPITYSISVLESPTPLKEWFDSILKDNGETFPYIELGMERPSTKDGRKTIFLEFISKLLAFWSGIRSLQTSIRYQVIAIDNPVPKSSTCFYQLKLPKNLPSRDDLYRRLVMAVYGVEQGIGSAGGKGKHSQRKRLTKYS